MPQRSEGPSSFQNPEAGQGGADAVNDTSGVAAHGTQPEQPTSGVVRARVHPGGGIPTLTWLLLGLILLVALIFALGII